MGIRVATVVVMLGLGACSPVPAPETPPPVGPTNRTPQREPLLPAPSNTPKVVYASVVRGPTTNLTPANARW